MNNHLLRRITKASFFVIIFILIVYLGYITVNVTPIGVEVTTDDKGNSVITSVEYAGRFKNNEVELGDIVLEINGKKASEHRTVKKYGMIEYADSILIKKQDGSIKYIEIPNNWKDNLKSEATVFDLIVPTLFLVIFSLVSLFLYLKCKNDRAAHILSWFFLAIGIGYFSSPASYRCDPIGGMVIFLVLPAIPFIFLYFMEVYLRRFQVQFKNSRLLFIFFTINMCIVIFHSTYTFTDVFSSGYYRLIQVVNYLTLTSGYCICVYRLVSVFLRYRNSNLRPLFMIILTAQIVAFTPFVTMNLIPGILIQIQLLSSTVTTVFLLVLPFSYMYLFTSNRLFDIDFIFTRFKYYTVLSIIPAITILLLLNVVLHVNQDFSSVKWFQIFMAVYGSFILFLYLKEQIDHRFRPKLFKQMYSYQDSIDRYSRQMSKVMKRSDLENVLHQEITFMLPMCRYQFGIIDTEKKIVKMTIESLQEQEVADELVEQIEAMQIADVMELSNGVALVVGKRKEEFHILWISSKSNHTQFNVDEMRWLKTISNYTSIVFENLYLIDSLIDDLEIEMKKQQSTSPWLLRLLFCLSENERRRLAADLHDSALQDQLLWFRKLESVLLDRQMDKNLAQELEEIKEGLLDVIHQIRETCNELRPPLLKELGVVEAIENLIDHARLQMNFSIHFHTAPMEMTLNEEQITAIYRIVQELLRNTEKHARATDVTIELTQIDNSLYFHYKDNGLGMEIEHLQSSFSHMGLSGIRERVISFEGTIEFISKPGQGFEVKIMMPVHLSKEVEERGAHFDSYLIS